MAGIQINLDTFQNQDIFIDEFRKAGFRATYKIDNGVDERPILGNLADTRKMAGDKSLQIYLRRNRLCFMGNDGSSQFAFASEDIDTYDEALVFIATLKLISRALDKTIFIGAGVGDQEKRPFLTISNTGDLQLFPKNYIDLDEV